MNGICRFLLVLVLPGLLAGCRSERVAFRLRPVPAPGACAALVGTDNSMQDVSVTALKGEELFTVVPSGRHKLLATSNQRARHTSFYPLRAQHFQQSTAVSRGHNMARFHALYAASEHLKSLRSSPNRFSDGLLLTVQIIAALLGIVAVIVYLGPLIFESAGILATIGAIFLVAAALIGIVLAFDSLL